MILDNINKIPVYIFQNMPTSVNGIKFPGGQARKLSHGDQIEIGEADIKQFLFLKKHPFSKCVVM